MFNDLNNTIIDKTKKEYELFPQFLDGHTFLEYDNGWVTQPPEEASILTPTSLTMRQTRLYLLSLDLLDDVESIVSQNKAWQIEWEYANEVLRTNQLIGALQNQLNLTDTQIDNMFIEANKL